MLPKFNPQQYTTANGKINASGPINWGSGDAGRKIVEMRVEFKPLSGTNCNGRFPPPGVTFDQGRDTVWSFEMPNNGMSLGLVTAKARAELDNGTRVEWEQGVVLTAG